MGKRQSAIDLTQGNELRVILCFTIPLFIGNVFQQLYNVVDSIIVGNYVGAQALASVGLCFPVIFTVFSLFMGIGGGTSVVVSRYCGAGEPRMVERAIRTAYVLIFVGCIPVSILGVLGAEGILKLIQVPMDILPAATSYLQVYFLGAFANLGFSINEGILRGLGDSRSSLRFLMIACLVNVVLDLLFVVQFHWSIVGVAVATLTAQALAWVMSMVYIRHQYLTSGERMRNFQLDRKFLGEICRIGIPTGIQHMIFSFGTMVMQAVINGCGSSFIAGFNAASKIDMFAFMPIQSFSTAATAFVGQNLGARRPDRIRRGLVSSLKLSLVMDVVIVGTIFWLSRPLLCLFNQEEAVIQAGLSYLYRILPFYLIFTVTAMGHALFRGIGDTGVQTVIMIVALWLGRVPSAYLLAYFCGEENLFFCYGIGWIIEIILLGLYYRSGHWKRKI